MPPWVASLIGVIILGLVGVVYASLRKSVERTDERIDEHIGEDVKAHERLARLETKVEQHDTEIRSLRVRWHEFRNETMKSAWEYFEERMARVFKKRDE